MMLYIVSNSLDVKRQRVLNRILSGVKGTI
jgi:hypothetical protein